MKSINAFILSTILVLSASCSSLDSVKRNEAPAREYQVGAYLWFQTSGEYRALCYQAYNLARLRLDRDLENKHNRKRALIFDIDETVLDNSFSGAQEIQNQIGWDQENFNLWVKQKAAEAIPGAKEFIEYAVSRRVEVIYISNRLAIQKDDTLENLKRLGIPAKKENLYFLNNDWSKEERRLEILKKYDVVMFFGDNLGDFHKDWDNKTSDERRALVDSHHLDFGEKFIVLPNPLYGDWEKALPKSKKRADLLKTVL
ncbi:MAG: 5'-nucleotidase, lipoprotein e(P4) family [Bacteriovorax sp.]|nr:5'-nucleotidase, lipoprotein e(P4) family [Bacteriovorax sp.]